jgi:hypothetical protein
MRKLLVNNTLGDVEIFDTGVTVPIEGYEITPQDHLIWERSKDVVTKIISEEISVSDGENILPRRIGIGLVQDNQIVLNEFYTLVQDDDVLIGNGQILYLNDEFPTTENVPIYMDEQIEDDDPTYREY